MLFLIISMFIFNITAILIPKRMTSREIYTAALFALVFVMIADMIYDLKYDLYGYITQGVQLSGIVAQIGLYPALSTMILNYFPFGKGFKHKAVYILAWTIFSLIFEWLSVKSGYFYYNGWKLWYSALHYPIIISILAINLHFVRHLKETPRRD